MTGFYAAQQFRHPEPDAQRPCRRTQRPVRRRLRAPQASPIPRRHVPDPRHKRRDIRVGIAEVDPRRARRLVRPRHPRPPGPRGPDRPGREPAPAIGADIGQPPLRAVGAKGAFIAADPSLRRVRRQILVTGFAIGAQGQGHGVSPIRRVRSFERLFALAHSRPAKLPQPLRRSDRGRGRVSRNDHWPRLWGPIFVEPPRVRQMTWGSSPDPFGSRRSDPRTADP